MCPQLELRIAVATRLQNGQPRIVIQFPKGTRFFFFFRKSCGSEPVSLSMDKAAGVGSWLHLKPNFKTRASKRPFPNMCSYRIQRSLYSTTSYLRLFNNRTIGLCHHANEPTEEGLTLISGFRRDVGEISVLLGYYAASCGNCLLTFRDNVSVSSSRVKSLYIPEERRSQKKISLNTNQRVKCKISEVVTFPKLLKMNVTVLS
jgi:hypothetical protein